MSGTRISVAIANYNGEAFLRDAVDSALAQRGVEVEVLIVDDQSTDGSWALAQALAAEHDRVRCWQLPENRGPGGARNLALAEARGDWFAVLDSDDLIHPDRFRRLVDEATRAGATMIADDLLVFDHARHVSPDLFLRGARARTGQWIDLAGYLRETAMYGRAPNLGFLKPMIRLDFLRGADLRYDERLRIAEDDDLIVRCLLAGARYRLLPQPMYFYRKHGRSISHRLSPDHADRMVAAAKRLDGALRARGDTATAAWARRRRALVRAAAFSHLVAAIKRRDPAGMVSAVRRAPSALLLLRQPIAAAAARLLRRRNSGAAAPLPTDRNAVLFISRQRLIGATNGSSAYLIALARAVREAGLTPHLLQPSPLIFGRTPFLRMRAEMGVFATVRIRGARKFGDWWIATNPRVMAAAARGVFARLLRRVGIGGSLSVDRKAPYAVAAPWTREDLLYVAAHGRGVAATAIADYIFQTEALPYLLDPQVRSATVMHDLFSARAEQFSGATADSVSAIDRGKEVDLLGRADAVVAIQADEAAIVAANVSGTTPILAAMAADPVAAPQPGDPDLVLFVGSNTAPNIHGLAWFVERVWPVVRAARPDARLAVAGTVAAGYSSAAPGVDLLGLVGDLAPLYARAGVVVSPLLQGSGLKIKLVEALAHGKASVVTGITLQGVEALLTEATMRADDPDTFAAAVTALLDDPAARTALATRALAAASEHFGARTTYRAFREWLTAGRPV